MARTAARQFRPASSAAAQAARIKSDGSAIQSSADIADPGEAITGERPVIHDMQTIGSFEPVIASQAEASLSEPMAAKFQLSANRGWIVVGSVFLTLGTLFGCTYAIGGIAISLEEGLGLSRDGIGLIMGLAFGGIYLGAPISGQLADRFGGRPVAITGMTLLAATFALGSAVTQPWQAITVLGGGIGLSMGLLYSPAMASIQTWFQAHRGLATGIAASGMGVGTFIIAPIVERLTAAAGLQAGLTAMAMLCAAVAIFAAPWIDAHPESRSRKKGKAQPTGQPGAPARVSVKSLIFTRSFLLLGGSSALGGFVMLTVLAHLAASAVDQGISPAEGAAMLAVSGLVSVPARILCGLIGDRIGRTRTLAWCYAALALSYGLWFFADSALLLYGVATIFGVAYGAGVVMRPAATADHFSGRWLATMVGVTYLMSFIGAVAGPVLYGVIREAYGNYGIGQLASVAICLLAAALVWKLDAETRAAANRN